MARYSKATARKGTKSTKSTKSIKSINAGLKQSHITMQQEARNTEGRNSRRMNIQLRHQIVKFVSAGDLHAADEFNTEKNSKERLEVEKRPLIEKEHQSTIDHSSICIPELQIIDRSTILTSPVLPVRPRSPTPEESSEDEIVFRGRRRIKSLKKQVGSEQVLVNRDTEEKGCDDGPSTYTHSSNTPSGQLLDHTAWSASEEDYISFTRISDHDSIQSRQSTNEDSILADYIANIDGDSEHEVPCTQNEEQPSDEDDKNETHRTAAMILEDSDLDPLDSQCEDTQLNHPYMSSIKPPSDEPPHIPWVRFPSAEQKQEKGIFASATAFADALELDSYYGFDIMDFSHPSLTKKKKKKYEHLDVPALDSELETELINAWNNDRHKKKLKKRERQELRTQGLLGRRKSDPDLKTKHADGMSIEDLKSEISQFLLSSKNSLSLPPMTKHRRVLIHDMAHALRLNSQSRGKGSSRFPIISKTSRTTKYTKKTILQIDKVFTKERFSARALKAWDKSSGRRTKAKRSHGNVSYMDGDVVGASAPEIGVENRGRAILEKMGWSTGTALGAMHNKGILQPVAHVVKNSKAGLG
ncbi:hypothetical protein BJX70DRAFT_160037 [Aspergillus crustosus]